MIISQGRLHLADKDPQQPQSLPIDYFFRSLAQDCGENSVAVVLSGTGSDGSRGLQDVHQAGGLVVCEDETTAKFDGMPLSAQNTGLVDLIRKAEDIPPALIEYLRDAGAQRARRKAEQTRPTEGVEAVFELLRREYDIDFSHYKPTTVRRRIERRLGIAHAQLDEYVERLREDGAELNALYKDLLIGVTKFFATPNRLSGWKRKRFPTFWNVSPGTTRFALGRGLRHGRGSLLPGDVVSRGAGKGGALQRCEDLRY